MFIMKIQPEYFEKIKNKQKIYEVRLLDDKRKQIKVGDSIVLKKEPELLEGIVIKVTEVRYFNTFLEMATSLSIKDLGFEGGTVEEVNNTYHKIYSPADEERLGVVAFKFELV